VLTNFENLTGSGQGDVLSGTSGVNVILGLGGDDTIEGRAGADSIDGGDGSDTASYANAGAAVSVDISVNGSTQTGTGDQTGDVLTNIENLTGSIHADSLIGSSGANVLSGGDGNDTLEGLAAADTIAGGEGVDTVTYARSNLAVTVDLTLASGQSGGDAEGDLLSSIENLTGSNQADTLSGNSAVNRILGGTGNDVIDGRSGADTLDGGDGTDTVTYVSSVVGVTVNLGLSTAQGGFGDESGDLLANFENLTGSAYGDTLTGNTGDNLVNGGGGNDVLYGGQGTDTLLGDVGNDTLDGGAGNDTLNGGDGSDTVDYSTSGAGVTVDLRLATAQGGVGAAAGDVLIDIENVMGSGHADTLMGNDSANTLNGGGGDDLLIGFGGADILNGGDGVDRVSYAASGSGIVASLDGTVGIFGDASGDTIVNVENITGSSHDDTLGASSVANQIEGGAGTDIVSYANATSAVTVNLALTTQAGSGWETGDVFTNVEGVAGSGFNDTLTGNGSDNILYGNGGVDTLSGAAGNDILFGGFGDDLLIGGAGADEMYGESGTDTVSYAGATARVIVDLRNMNGIEADAAGDQYSGIERWIATDHNDYFYGGSSVTHVTGGAGNDHINYSDSNAAINVNLSLTTAQANGGFAGGDTLLSIESIEGSWHYGDTLTGSNANEWFYGLHGNDTLSGGGGNDWLRGDTGGDTIDGGDGYDTYAINEWSDDNDWVTVYVDGRTSVGAGAANGDTAVNVERVYGGWANETVVAANGLQRFDGNDGFDTIDFQASTAGVTVDLNLVGGTAQTSAGLASDFVLTGVESVLGTGFADTLTGDGNNNTLGGLGGADSLTGDGGNDTFLLTASQLTGASPDLVRVDGGAGYDAIEISGLSAGQSVSLAHLLSTNGSGQQVGTSIEQVGLRDGLVQNVTISAADVQALVGAGDSSLLTLRVDNGELVNVTDAYKSVAAGGVTIYSDAAMTQQIAQINYLTA
jgi:Ca2+-binding RTX toxin-like protein